MFFSFFTFTLSIIFNCVQLSGSIRFTRACWWIIICLFSCGKVMPGCKTKLDKPDQDGNGEICFWGRHVFMGYLNMSDKTAEAIDQDGWLHSGDLGKHDQDNFLYITGRIKGELWLKLLCMLKLLCTFLVWGKMHLKKHVFLLWSSIYLSLSAFQGLVWAKKWAFGTK